MREYRSGFIALLGRPNTGKSTLLNALLGQKIASVSPRPQTTRRRQLGILTRPDAQLIFVDAPGLHNPRHKLGEFLNQEAEAALEGVDVILFLVDISAEPGADDERIASLLRGLPAHAQLVLAANKCDLIQAGEQSAHLEAYRALVDPGTKVVLISAARGDGLTGLQDVLISMLPVRPPDYEEDQVTDLYERDLAADLIREGALLKLRDEVPHGIAVRIDEFKERANGTTYIAATVFVERESQKGIVIGDGGRMLKQIGSYARREIESMGGHKVYLDLRVKVEKDWRNDEAALKHFGYKIKK